MKIKQNLLLFGMALMIPCFLFTVGNVLLAPFSLYGRSRVLLAALTALCFAGLLLLLRAADRFERFFERRERAVLLAFSGFYFIAQLALGAALRHAPITDAEQCFTAASLLADTGTYGGVFRYWEYFTRYPHNLGLVYLLGGTFRLFGLLGWTDRYMQAVLLGAALFTPGLIAAASVVREFGGVRAQARMLLLFLFCLPFLYASAELYTDAFSLSFPALIVLCAMRLRRAPSRRSFILWAAGFALCSFIGLQIRATSVVATIACAIWLLLGATPRRFFAAMALTLCAFLSLGAALDRANERHLTREALDQYALPVLHYVAMGLPVQVDEGYGQYGDGGWLIYSTSFDDPAERDAALLEQVVDRVYYLRYPNRLLHMLSRKNLSTFGNGTFGLSALIEADEPQANGALRQVLFSRGALYPAYYHLCTGLFLAQILLAVCACIQAIARRNETGAPLFIALLGIFLFLCIWETQPRYFFQYQPLLLCAASLLEPERMLPKRRSR